MGKNSDILIQHDNVQNSKIIQSEIKSTLNKILNNEALNQYAKLTNEEKRKKLSQYKKDFQQYSNLQGQDVTKYFEAYELILKFREFILGDFGKIDYTFSIQVRDRKKSGNVYMKTITLGSESFIDLIKGDKDNKGFGLEQSGSNLRFSSAFLSRLTSLIRQIEGEKISIKVNPNYFSLVNETLGTKQDFTNGKLMKSNIEFYQRNRNVEKWYEFIFKITKDISDNQGKRVFRYAVESVKDKENNSSSSIFSAIGKFFADWMTQTRIFVNNNKVSVDISYPNAGNLTQLYILAKQRLNKGHNVFRDPKRQRVQGQTLLNLYREIKANTEPFYSGGDVLTQQIKSFLGSMPSLSSLSTIQNTVKSFLEALNKNDINEIKEALKKLLLQNNSSAAKISQQEVQVSEAIAESFESFFTSFQS